MAKEDFCFTYYDGDAAKDVAHMNRLERGCYLDIIHAQRKRGRLSLTDCKKVLGKDFESCWPSIEWILKVDAAGNFFVEWLENSLTRSKAHSEKQKGNIKKRYNQNPTNPLPNGDLVTPLGNGNGDGNGNKDINENSFGKSENLLSEEMDVDLVLQKVLLDEPYRVMCEGAGYPPSRLESWMAAFNRFLKFKGKHRCREDLWRLGFPGWMCYHNYQNGEDPEQYNPVIWAKKKKEDFDKIIENGKQLGTSGGQNAAGRRFVDSEV